MNKCLNARYKVADDDSSFIRPINISRERKQLVNKQCDILIKKKHTPQPAKIQSNMKSSSNKNSKERIKVYDVFQHVPRNKSQSTHCKYIDDSREILNKLQQRKIGNNLGNDHNELQQELKKTSKFFEPIIQQETLDTTCNRKRSTTFLPPKNKLFQQNDNSISYIQPLEEQKQRKIKINLQKVKDENILDLLLLNTVELKQKINSYRCNSSFICVRPGKLPKDFFNFNQQKK